MKTRLVILSLFVSACFYPPTFSARQIEEAWIRTAHYPNSEARIQGTYLPSSRRGQEIKLTLKDDSTFLYWCRPFHFDDIAITISGKYTLIADSLVFYPIPDSISNLAWEFRRVLFARRIKEDVVLVDFEHKRQFSEAILISERDSTYKNTFSPYLKREQ